MNWTESNSDSNKTFRLGPFAEQRVICRPFLKWVGGKTELLPHILRRMPPLKYISVYHEPFVGGGAVFFALQPPRAMLADVNPELINSYAIVKHSVEALIKDLKRHQHSEEYFYQIRNIDRSLQFKRWSDVRRASRLIYLNKTCYNGLFRVNSKGHFNTPFGRYSNPNYLDVENLTACSKALKGASILLGGFDEIIYRARAGDFVYFDPPYVPVSKTANFTSYSKNGFGLEKQKELYELCSALHSKKVRFMLSNSATPYIKKLYSKFKIDIVSASRSVNSNAKKRGPVKEVLVINY